MSFLVQSRITNIPMTEDQVARTLAKLSLRISDVLEPWIAQSPDHPALVEASGQWTYREMAEAIAEARVWLRDSGVRAGDRVMMVCENCRALVAVILGTVGLDAWPVLVNAHLSPDEIDKIRDHCGARRVIYTTSVSVKAREHVTRHGASIIELELLGKIAIGPLNHTTEPEPIDDDVQSRVAAMLYTSGTTGGPKGVMLTHRNLLYVASATVKIRSLTADDRLFGVLPMSHVVGLSVILLGSLLAGATVYLTPRFDPMSARKTLEHDQITVMLGVPSMFAQFVQYAKMRKLKALNFPALRLISCSGAPLQATTKAEAERLFGLVLHHAYGLTEMSPNVSQTRPEFPRSDTSVGPVFPGVEIKVLGTDGKPVPEGQVGELLARGPNVMKGYYRAPEETSAAIGPGGWFNTRDLARVEAGNLFIVGRTKDLIIHSGFNVYPAEVEAVLNGHPAVAISAAIGKSTEGDEEIIAFVQLLPGASVTEGELADYAADHLAFYKRPSHFVLRSMLPVTPTGKIMRAELAKLVAEIEPARRKTGTPQTV
jgi:long-chain acyl-CoA synthetase